MKRIIFLPGIMGSELHEGKEFHGTTKRWFKGSDKHLKRLEIVPGQEDYIYAGDPLDYGDFHGIKVKSKPIYGPLMEKLDRLGSDQVTFHKFGYDWRKDVFVHCTDLDQMVSQFGKNDEIIFVAHSMGGLVTHTYCQWAKANNKLPNITKVITLGTPWHGSGRAVQILKYGFNHKSFMETLAWPSNDEIRNIGRTFPSLVQLLPPIHYVAYRRYLVSEDNRSLSYKESMDYVKQIGCVVPDMELLNQKLHITLQNPWPSGISHYNLVGCTHGTMLNLQLSSTKEDYMNFYDGDETVTLLSAEPPAIYNSIIMYTEATHEGLCYSESVIEWIDSIITQGEPVALPEIKSHHVHKKDWVTSRVACPVEVVISEEDPQDTQVAENRVKAKRSITTHQLGDVTYVVYNETVPKQLKVESYGHGRAMVETQVIKDGEIVSVNRYPSIDINPTTRTILNVTFDQENVPHTEVLVSNETQQDFPSEGYAVKLPSKKEVIEKPTSSIKLNALGNSKGKYFDDQGVTFEIRSRSGHPDFDILETLYRINPKEDTEENEGWNRYKSAVSLTIEKGLIYGKNVIQYRSRDVLDNLEAIRTKEFIVEHPLPYFSVKLQLDPETSVSLSLESPKESKSKYKFYYSTTENNEGQGELYTEPLRFRFNPSTTVYVRAEDMFERTSGWKTIDIDFEGLIEELWKPEGFEGTIKDIVALLPQSIEEFRPQPGTMLTVVDEKISGKAKSLHLTFEKTSYQIEYKLTLISFYEFYLDKHSELYDKEENELTLGFWIFDKDGNREKTLEPTVTCTVFSQGGVSKETFRPDAVLSNDKGLYTFNVCLKDLTFLPRKMRIDFRDSESRPKPLKTSEFKFE